MSTNILFESRGLINGTLLDCLDLFVYCSMRDIPITFSLIDTNGMAQETLKTIKLLYKERSYDDYYSSKILDTINIVSKVSLLKVQRAVFFDYVSLKNSYTFLKNANIVCVSNLQKNEDIAFLNNIGSNVSFWGEKSYGFHTTFEYIPKLLLPKTKERGCLPLVVCPGMSEKEIENNTHLWGGISLPKEYIFRGKSSYNSLWSNFNEVIYLQSPTVYDRKPRIIYEARECDIPLSYHRCLDRNEDGSTHRYNDKTKREYTESDRLVEWIQNEK